MRLLTPNPLSVECDVCGSRPGERCYGEDGRTSKAHGSRQRRALEAAAITLLRALETLYDAHDPSDSYCDLCERHAPKDTRGTVTGPITHRDDCILGEAEHALRVAEGRS